MKKFCIVCKMKTGVLLLCDTHPSTEFVILGLICVQINITVCEREMHLLGIAHCMCHMPKLYTGLWCDIMIMIIVVAQSEKFIVLQFNLLIFVSHPCTVDLFGILSLLKVDSVFICTDFSLDYK